MRKLIYLTGQIDHPFLCNEIDQFRKHFDEVLVVAYDDDIKSCDALSKRYDFKYVLISGVGRGFGIMLDLLAWSRQPYVKQELKRQGWFGMKALKKRAYVYLYGLYGVKLKRLLDGYVKPEDEVYVYSFWLSRPAFGNALISNWYGDNVRNCVSRTHRYDLYEEENELGYLPFRQYICENIGTIYFSSKDTIEYYSNKHYSDRKQPVYKLSYLGTRAFERKKLRAKDELVIVSCSAIIQRKRLDLIVRFVKELMKKTPNCRWIHIGDGELEDDIRRMAAAELPQGSYEFAGRVTDDDIYDIYRDRDADFFVNLSDSEGIPVSIMEAMSMGIPIIARNVGGIADAVCDGKNGFLIDEVEAIEVTLDRTAERVARAFRDQIAYGALSESVYQMWNDTFNGKRNADLIAGDITGDSSACIPEITVI